MNPHHLARWSTRHAPLLWSVGLTLWGLDALEWWAPSCEPDFIWNASGFPVPYLKPSGATSLDYEVMPLAALFDLAAGGVFWYLVVAGVLRLADRWWQSLRRFAGWSGLAQALLAIAFSAAALAFCTYRPVLVLGGAANEYLRLRPFVSTALHCPSGLAPP